MIRHGRANGGIAALMTVVLIAACSPAVPSPYGAARYRGGADNAVRDSQRHGVPAVLRARHCRRAGPSARWSDCGKGFLCAEIRVPRDYAAPSDGYLNISILKLPATDPRGRIGSLIVNPGGPGASGVEFVREGADADVFPAALRKHFDIVGFDPRGVNSSTADPLHRQPG